MLAPLGAELDTMNSNNPKSLGFTGTARAVVTDGHFLIPLVVLLIGITLLVALH